MQAEAPSEVTRAEFLNLFVAVFLPMFMAAVDQTLLATATPAIAHSLGGLRDIPVAGMALASVALLVLGLAPPSMALVAALGFLTGAGFGTVMPTTQVLVQTVAGRQKLGAVTAMAGLARSTGGAAGAALFGAIVFALIPQADGETAGGLGQLALPEVVRAFHRAFLFAAALAALGAFTASRIPRIRLWGPAAPQPD